MRASDKKKDIVVEINVAKTVRFIITVLMSAIFLFVSFMFVRSFLPVTKFEINGDMTYRVYNTGDFTSAADIERGDKLYKIDLDLAEKKILEECTYLKDVDLKRAFPNKLIINVEEKLPHWYIELAGKYYSLDSELVVIEEAAGNESYIAAGVTRLALPNVKRVVVGELPEFGESKLEIEKTIETISAIRETEFKSRITGVDLKSRFNIYMEIDNVREVYMGDASNMDSKLKALEAVVMSMDKDDTSVGYIDASNPAAISFGTAQR